jgi:hypothetical protein
MPQCSVSVDLHVHSSVRRLLRLALLRRSDILLWLVTRCWPDHSTYDVLKRGLASILITVLGSIFLAAVFITIGVLGTFMAVRLALSLHSHWGRDQGTRLALAGWVEEMRGLLLGHGASPTVPEPPSPPFADRDLKPFVAPDIALLSSALPQAVGEGRGPQVEIISRPQNGHVQMEGTAM